MEKGFRTGQIGFSFCGRHLLVVWLQPSYIITANLNFICKTWENMVPYLHEFFWGLDDIFVVQLLSHVQLFVTPWTAAYQASLFFTISQSLLKFMSIESMMPSNHLTLCPPLLLLPSIFPSIKVFSNQSALYIRWLKYELQPQHWSFQWIIRVDFL